jgi:hypothetical protein
VTIAGGPRRRLYAAAAFAKPVQHIHRKETSSMLRRLFYKNRKFYDDDFDWENYTADSYERRLKRDVESQHDAYSPPGTLRFDAATGTLDTQGRNLHPNQHLILETIGRLSPASVHETGCGGGDHIATAAALYPDISCTGGDRGQTQLELALRRHPELAGRIGVQDITMPFSSQWPAADLVYTQAVIMHIHTAVSHMVALANLVRQAQKYVLLMENLQCHNFVRDVQALAQGGHLPWAQVVAHRVDGSGGARALLLAQEALDFPVIRSDVELREGLKPSQRRLTRSDEDSARGLFGFARP